MVSPKSVDICLPFHTTITTMNPPTPCSVVFPRGHSFRSSYLKLSCLREQFEDVPIIALSATATHHVLVGATAMCV